MSDPIEIQVWWIGQLGTPEFEFPVPTFEAGFMLADALGSYDAHQLKHRIRGDYCNMGGVQWRHPKRTQGEWWDIDEHEPEEMAYALGLAP